MAFPLTAADDPKHAFIRNHVIVIPLMLMLLGQLSSITGLDVWLTDQLYDPAIQDFPLRAIGFLEVFGHRLAKSAVWIIWSALCILAIAAPYLRWPLKVRSTLIRTALGMGFGPLVVTLLKGFNDHHCPWALARYGGAAEMTMNWFVGRSEAGYCYPGGHAAAGFCLVALMFGAQRFGHTQWARIAFWLTIVVGVSFSALRIGQGAHFLSHNLVSASICWFLAAIVSAWPERAQGAPAIAEGRHAH